MADVDGLVVGDYEEDQNQYQRNKIRWKVRCNVRKIELLLLCVENYAFHIVLYFRKRLRRVL